MIIQWFLFAILGTAVPDNYKGWYVICLILYTIHLIGKKIIEDYGKVGHDYDDYNDWSE